MNRRLTLLLCAVLLTGCANVDQDAPEAVSDADAPAASTSSITERVEDRTFPSVFQAWNPLDMPDAYPLRTSDERIRTAAKHDLLWEEPVSQLGFGTDLVLGVVWEGENQGVATRFTEGSREQALRNRARLLELNPDMVMLMEIRWRDAPGSYLPEDSDWWLRNEDGTRKAGWTGGPEPYYLLNYENPDFQDHVAVQARVAVESGIYDGVMLDWSGHLPIVQKVRQALGDDGLVTVNIHDDLEDGARYAPYINGSFMECDPDRMEKALCSWDGMARALETFEATFREPQVNALEAWGDRGNLASMRAVTTLGLTHSDAYVLFADPNPLPTPDHLHDWYDFWDADLGRPAGVKTVRDDGAVERAYDNGLVVYNPQGNGPVTVAFSESRRRASDGTTGTTFELADTDGDFFLTQ